ncbi:DUF3048 domain-containing protein [Enemella sp. A6]|uniref:DUF3048 domain-containing protein n=1 Tax=Enemella sp. A6 TaxID=3440152 RepID=UPI003EBF0302
MAEISRRTLLWGGLAAAGVLATGCGQNVDSKFLEGKKEPTQPPPSTPPPAPPPVWPLTGKPLPDEAAGKHAAVAVKVPDNKYEHPQSGINDADLVFVQLDGYVDSSGQSATRLMPVFHTTLPEGVIPVRSIRPVDVPLLAPIGAVVGNTGGAQWVVNYAEKYSDHLDVSQTYMETRGTGSYSIDGSRVYTYDGQKKYDRAVVAHPKVLSQRNEKFAQGPAKPYLPFAVGDDKPSTENGNAARQVEVPWKRNDAYTMRYEFDEGAGLYRRFMPWGEHTLVDGEQVTTENILVIRAEVTTEKIFEGKGGAEPIHGIMSAKGAFTYCHGGKAVTGTWAKGEVQEPFTFTLDDGSPLKIAPGRTFVELPYEESEVRLS